MSPTAKPRRRRGAVRQILESGILEAYRLDALAVLAFVLIGITIHKLNPDLLWAYAGVVLLLLVLVLGKAASRPEKAG